MRKYKTNKFGHFIDFWMLVIAIFIFILLTVNITSMFIKHYILY
jgi:hypothetical protein